MRRCRISENNGGVCGKNLEKTIEISERISKTWTILPKRWVVERTFSWLNGYRRLDKEFEISTSSAENYVMISHSMLLLKRLAKSC
jgi:putative transposase